MEVQLKSHHYNYYNIKGRYSPSSPETAAWVKTYETVDDRIESNNRNKDSDTYNALVKLENLYYEQGVKNRAQYSTYQELQSALAEKYLGNNSPYAGKYTYCERRAMYNNELNMSAFGHCTNLSDPRLGGAVQAESDNEKQSFNRKSVNNQLKNILSGGGVDLSELSKYDIRLTIEPYDYRLTILGIYDNDELKNTAENILNSGTNSKELFFHILNSVRNSTNDITDDIILKYRTASELKSVAGLDLRDFEQTKDGFVNSKGENMLDLYREALKSSTSVPSQYRSVAYDYFSSMTEELSKKSINSIPDLVLSIGLKNCSLYDVRNENLIANSASIIDFRA